MALRIRLLYQKKTLTYKKPPDLTIACCNASRGVSLPILTKRESVHLAGCFGKTIASGQRACAQRSAVRPERPVRPARSR